MNAILKYVLLALGTLVGLFLLFLIFATLDDYKPKERIEIYKVDKTNTVSIDTVTVMSWNIGYCGMDESIDFFYDGGKQTRVSKKRTKKNIADIKKYLQENAQQCDIIFLQEIDVKAKRSYRTNQLDTLSNALKKYKVFFGKNYDVFFIPVPVSKPYGKVIAGVGTFTKPEPFMVERYQYPGNYAWPTKLFMLDRCFLTTRYKLSNGKELIAINLHNSAFDDGSLRAQQLEYLKNFATAEYQKGNYLIIGGDWNQRPPKFKPNYTGYIFTDKRSPCISETIFPSDWKFVFDNTVPTNRNSDVVWDKKTTPVTTIDFFLISPNVEALSVKGLDLGFVNSDHNPVIGKFVLKQ